MVTGYSNSEDQFQVTFDQATTTANTCQTSTAVYGPFVTPVTILGLLGDNTTNAQQPCELESNALGNWYVIYPTPGAEVTVKTCSEYAEFDTQLAVLSGSDCGDTTCVAYNDDSCSTHYRQLSTVTFRASGARFFFVYVTNYGSATGYYYLTISEEIAHASGDNCATAYEIPSPGVYDGFSNAGSDLIIESACNSATVNCPATWFAISPPAGCTVTVTTCSEATDFDTTITSFSSCKLASRFAHNDDSSLCEVNYRSSMLSVYSAQPRIYFAVRGFRCRTGNFSFTVDY